MVYMEFLYCSVMTLKGIGCHDNLILKYQLNPYMFSLVSILFDVTEEKYIAL